MVLTAAVALPFLVGAVLLGLGDRVSAPVARAAAGVAVIASAGLVAAGWYLDAPERFSWIPELGIDWSLRLDGLNVAFVLLTAAVGILIVGHTAYEMPQGGAPASYLGAVLIAQAGALTAFLAGDALLFFVAFEIVLVPMWFVIRRFGDGRVPEVRDEASTRFVLYTAVGSTLMLVGILLLAVRAGSTDFDRLVGALPGQDAATVAIVLLLTVGLCVKIPVFPLHTWLPPAHTIAPTGGSVLLAAVLLKLGTYGVIRLPLASAPDAFAFISPWLALAGAFAVVWGGLICLAETDLKRLIAYSSVAHMGFVALAVASGSSLGVQAAIYTSVAHGVVSAFLFILVGGLKHRWGSADLTVSRPALREVSPALGFFLVLGMAAGMGLPGLAVFWGEFLTLYAAWSPGGGRSQVVFLACVVVAAIGAALGAAYTTRVLRAVWVGDAVRTKTGLPVRHDDASRTERALLGVLGLAMLALGVAPGILLTATAGVGALLGGLP